MEIEGNERWIPGTLTNTINVLNENIKPDLLIVLDMPKNNTALREAFHVGIPSIAICDTDCDPTIVTYPIPGNDDSISSVDLILGLLSQSALQGSLKKAPTLSKELSQSIQQFGLQ